MYTIQKKNDNNKVHTLEMSEIEKANFSGLLKGVLFDLAALMLSSSSDVGTYYLGR
jgi:hypothetical protein